MHALGSRIDTLTKQLIATNAARTSDHNEAYFQAHVAFISIWRKDPNLVGQVRPMRVEARRLEH